MFGKNRLVLAQNFPKSFKLTTFCGFTCLSPPSYMKTHQNPSLKPCLAPENGYFNHFSLYFYIINLCWKSLISAIPDCLPTQISRAMKKIYWHSVKSVELAKKSTFIRNPHHFGPQNIRVPPIALRLQRNGVKMSTMDKIVSLKKHSPSNWYSVFYS